MKKTRIKYHNFFSKSITVSNKKLKVSSDEYMAATIMKVELSSDDDALTKFGIFLLNRFIM